MEQAAPEPSGWREEAEDLARGMTGGLLIGTPLLYTMETWLIGSTLPPLSVLLLLAIAYVLNFLCVVWAGFRRGNGGIVHLLSDALDATALALVTSAVVLAILAQIGPGEPVGVMLGQIVLNSIPVSLGIAIANHLVARSESRAESGPGNADVTEGERLLAKASPGVRATVLDFGATAAGALFFAFNIAPTDEVRVLADELPTLYVPLIIAFSLAVTYAIVFVAGFSGQSRRRTSAGLFQRPVTETVSGYLVSLAVATGALWLFGAIDPGTDPLLMYAQIIVLGLPAAIGGAAGRLAI